MKKFFFLHILSLNLKISYQIASLFDMYIDMGDMIAGKQDRPSLIIGDPPPSGPPDNPKYTVLAPMCHLAAELFKCRLVRRRRWRRRRQL